jgi:Lectin C-type domain
MKLHPIMLRALDARDYKVSMGPLRSTCSLSAVGAALGVSIACTEYESSLDRGAVAPLPVTGTTMGPGVRGTVPGLAAPIVPVRGEGSPDAALPSGATVSGSLADAGADAGSENPSVPDVPDAAPADCLDGSVAAGRCYRASSTSLTWTEARMDCLSWGGDLVSIQSTDEDTFVGALLDDSIWIGASDQTTEGVFTWADGSAIVFGNWGAAQPDAFPGPDCVEKRQELGEPWYDQPCSNAESHVCERALVP